MLNTITQSTWPVPRFFLHPIRLSLLASTRKLWSNWHPG